MHTPHWGPAGARGAPVRNDGPPGYFGVVDLRLSGRRAFVTGASRGIGLAIARGLALEGAVVSIGVPPPPTGWRRRSAGWTVRVSAVHPYVVDVTDAAALEGDGHPGGDGDGAVSTWSWRTPGCSRGGGIRTSTAEDWMYTMNAQRCHAATAIRAAVRGCRPRVTGPHS